MKLLDATNAEYAAARLLVACLRSPPDILFEYDQSFGDPKLFVFPRGIDGQDMYEIEPGDTAEMDRVRRVIEHRSAS